MNIIHALEAMPWGPYREITTVSGPMKVKKMEATSDFWALWKRPELREQMKKSGYTMKKMDVDGQPKWMAFRWVKFVPDSKKKSLLEDSMAKDSDENLMRPPGIEYRPFQRAGIKYCIDRLFGQGGFTPQKAVLLGDDMGLGKACNIHANVLTPTGWKKIGELKVGDEVIDADGMASNVTGVFPQGIRPIYEILFSDGVKATCDLEHLWEVRDANMATRGRGWTVMTLGEMMKRGLQLKSGANKFEIPQFPGHLFTRGKQPKIDGWLLGQLIGNGSTGSGDSKISIASNTLDTDVISRLESHGGIRFEATSEGCTQLRFPIYAAGRLADDLHLLHVACKSKEKRLHPSLLVTPWAYRVDLLQGLMDADGSNNKNRITYHTCSPQLAQDVAQLVRSLGGAAVVREYDRSAEGKPTEWQVNVHTQFYPFWSARKAKGWKADTRSRGNKIQAVRYLYDAEAVCIMVDHPRHLYVTEGYKLTHNTVQAIGVMNQDPELRNIRALIVCPASLKLNWRNELQRWLMDGMGSEAFVVRKEWPGPLQQARFVIVNYDLLHKFEREIRSEEWDYLIMDEAHFLKSQKSRRTVYALGGVYELDDETTKIVETIPAKHEIFMTGTPIPNRVKEGWTLFERCDPEGIGANFSVFVKRYCTSNDNLKELQERLRVKCMVRRAKSEVLKELPPKQRQVIPLDPEDLGCSRLFKQEMSIFKEYQALIQTWQVQIELAKLNGVEFYRKTLAAKKQKLGMKASELAKLRMSTAMAKVPAVIEHVHELKKEGKKVILFAHHISVMDALEEGLKAKGMTLVRVDGGTSINRRQEAVESFQAGKVDVFLGGIIPAGVGLTLTAADTVVFCELDWVPGNMTQAEDRAHRMGQLLIVWVLHIVMEGSLDEYIAKKLIQKQETIEKALDAKSLDEDSFADEDEAADAMLAKETAASKGVSAEKLQEEAGKLTEIMISAISTALNTILKVDNSVDQEILDTLRKEIGNGTATRMHLALARRILFRRRGELDQSTAKALEWPKKEDACTKQ